MKQQSSFQFSGLFYLTAKYTSDKPHPYCHLLIITKVACCDSATNLMKFVTVLICKTTAVYSILPE